MTNFTMTGFKANLKAAALDRQAALFAQADAIDTQAQKLRKHLVISPRIDKLNAAARALRDEACALGDRYHQLVAA